MGTTCRPTKTVYMSGNRWWCESQCKLLLQLWSNGLSQTSFSWTQTSVKNCWLTLIKRTEHQFDAITVNSKELECVNSVKVLGTIIASTLQWNCHISDVLKKANKQMSFLILLQRAYAPAHDIISFYLICTRPVLNYCAPLYHHALPDYSSNDKECVQKRALSVISLGLLYRDNLSLFNLNSLKDRHIEQCNKFLKSIVSNIEHKLHFVPPKKPYHL